MSKFGDMASPPTSPSDNGYDKHISHALNISESDCKYIHITEEAISFSFPLKLKLEIWVGDKKLILDKEARNEVFKIIGEFFRYELYKGGFKDILVYSTDPAEREEKDFFRDICSDGEAIEAVQWLLEFKKRFGF